jgi:hypothetical protein
MHDPEVVVFDLKLPIPLRCQWRDARPGKPRWTLGRRTFTNVEHLGQPVYPWWRAEGYQPLIAGHAFRWTGFLTVWHNEPKGHDSATVCKGMGGSNLTWRNVRWAIKHRRHLSVQVHPYQRVNRWLRQRCAGCGRRFFWHDARFGYMSSDDVYHDQCMSLRTVRSQLDDLTKYVRFEASSDEQFRVEYRLKGLAEKEAAKS